MPKRRGGGRGAWLKFLCILRAWHGHHPHKATWFTGREGLGQALVRMLDKDRMGRKTITWYNFRQMGAARLLIWIAYPWSYFGGG